jgi:hypothetical protein
MPIEPSIGLSLFNGLFAKSFLLWAYIAAYALCANYHIVKQDTDIAVFPVEKSA